MADEGAVRNPVWSYLFKSKRDEPTLTDLLAGLPIFEDLSKTQLKGIARILHERSYVEGEKVFSETEPGAGLYIIKQGRIEVTKQIEGGAPMLLAEFVGGNFFGELALIDEIPRSATATVTEPTDLLAFPKPDLDRLIAGQPHLAVLILRNLSRLVARRLVQANKNFESLQARPNQGQ